MKGAFEFCVPRSLPSRCYRRQISRLDAYFPPVFLRKGFAHEVETGFFGGR